MDLSHIRLDRLEVASPCSQSWEKMVGDDRSRFCSECKLNVYNLAAMSRHEAEVLIAQKEGRLCARFYRRHDNTVLASDCPIGLRAIRKRVSRIAATTFSTIFSLVSGNLPTLARQQDQTQQKIKIDRSESKDGSTSVAGMISDVAGALIPGAEVKFIPKTGNKEYAVRTSDKGTFQIAHLEAGEYSVKISSPGFKLCNLTGITVNPGEALKFNLPLDVGVIMGDLVFVSEKIPTNDTQLPRELIRKKKPLQ